MHESDISTHKYTCKHRRLKVHTCLLMFDKHTHNAHMHTDPCFVTNEKMRQVKWQQSSNVSSPTLVNPNPYPGEAVMLRDRKGAFTCH